MNNKVKKAIIENKRYFCRRCLHDWIGRKDYPPLSCPKCKSYTWSEHEEPKENNH